MLQIGRSELSNCVPGPDRASWFVETLFVNSQNHVVGFKNTEGQVHRLRHPFPLPLFLETAGYNVFRLSAQQELSPSLPSVDKEWNRFFFSYGGKERWMGASDGRLLCNGEGVWNWMTERCQYPQSAVAASIPIVPLGFTTP